MIFAKTGGVLTLVLTFVLLCGGHSESQRQHQNQHQNQHKGQHSSTGSAGAKRHAQNEKRRLGFLLIGEGAFEGQKNKHTALNLVFFSIVCPLFANRLPTVCQLLANCLPAVCQSLINCLLTVCPLLADCLSVLFRQAFFYVPACYGFFAL